MISYKPQLDTERLCRSLKSMLSKTHMDARHIGWTDDFGPRVNIIIYQDTPLSDFITLRNVIDELISEVAEVEQAS